MKPAGGFTLLELLLVASLVVVLLGLAWPSYQTHVLRSHRVLALTSLLSGAACQERQRVASGRYQPGACTPTASGHYVYSWAWDSAGVTWRIIAEPQARQRADACGALWLDAVGTRGAAEGADPLQCWGGR